MKKIIAIVLSVIMIFTVLPFAAVAANTIVVYTEAELDAVAETANPGDTVKLGADLDFTYLPRVTYHEINLNGLTLDLDGHTITGNNHSVVYIGDNFTIKNGTMVAVSDPNYKIQPNNAYAVVVYPQASGANDAIIDPSTGVVLEDLDLIGGVNCWGAEVTLRDLDVAGTTYYAVWSDDDTTITVESGNYTSECSSTSGVIACSTQAQSHLYVKGGTYTVPEKAGVALVLSGNRDVVISGGTFKNYDDSACTVAAKYLAEGATCTDGVVAQTSFVKIGDVLYADLDAAIAAANPGDTIKLIADLDLTNFARRGAHAYDIKNLTLDLNGHTITNYNHGVIFKGSNGTIKNGSFVCVSDTAGDNNAYGLAYYAEEYTFTGKTPTPPDLKAVSVKSTGVVLEDLDIIGGVNIKGTDAVLKNLNVSGQTFYAVWDEFDSHVTIQGGSYKSASRSGGNSVLAGSNDSGEVAYITVESGEFVAKAGQNMINTSAKNVTVSGGAFTYADGTPYTLPAANIATGKVQYAETGVVGDPATNEYNLEVGEDIQVNFYIDAEAYDVEDGYIEYEYIADPSVESAERTTFTQDIAGILNGSGEAVLNLKAAPAQIAEEYIMRVYNAAGEHKDTITASIAGYCEALKEDSTFGNLMVSILNYGQLANEYFNYGETKGDSTYEVPHTEDYRDDLSAAEEDFLYGSDNAVASRTQDYSSAAAFAGVTYIAQMDPEFRFYFNGTREVAGITCSNPAVKAKTYLNGNNAVVVVVNGLKASDFGTTFTLNIDGINILFNGYGYLRLATNDADAAMRNLAKGVFRYAQAAEALA